MVDVKVLPNGGLVTVDESRKVVTGLSSSGSTAWTTSVSDESIAVKAYADGSVVLLGQMFSPRKAVVTKLDAFGTLKWRKQFDRLPIAPQPMNFRMSPLLRRRQYQPQVATLVRPGL